METHPPPEKPVRIVSVDAFRGLVMTLMFAEILELPRLGALFPHSALARFISFHTEHVEWQGGSLHDMIQPGFSFLVGISLPFSIAARRAKGQTFGRMLGHAVWRAVLLVVLGILLRSLGRTQTYFTFEDTLTQIGLGYVFLFLLAWVRMRTQIAALVLILVGYWALFAFYPAPGPGFDYPSVGVPAHWPEHYTGFLSHWNKNSNPAWAFDRWFLNLFPREHPFVYNAGGYATLSFVPTLGTMVLGLITGEWIKRGSRAHARILRVLLMGGVGLAGSAVLLQSAGICPIVKRIWTPAFVLYSGGIVVLIMAGLYAVMELKRWQRWAFPLVVVGMNSIAIYVMSWTMKPFVLGALTRHLGSAPFLICGPAFEPVLLGVTAMLVFWMILYWMYRRRVFLRI